ncbi:hypothetical protein HRG_008185 [Hirsutella rhossiliensis]|uniref:Peptidase M43 pregnancy-associated plasma-A domain-containing protein n=1 Tax=Hirsutella rhossiliensis TaxID=111463 RepID=A0A9P8MXL7_9HYPO|nr:uncharacterized protein HRG_08185 [Hirsutella rhossiliensis]KAH0961032.1 hypothetical protein HRG_08185 [Hirsutella rhossiliensis]
MQFVLKDVDWSRAYWTRENIAQLHQGKWASLNVYVLQLSEKHAGQARANRFEDSFDPMHDFIRLNAKALPGSSHALYNEGKSLPHEIAHWLGLGAHSAGRSCVFNAGNVPAEKPAIEGGRISETCVEEEYENTTNNLLITVAPDNCSWQFTCEQVRLMREYWTKRVEADAKGDPGTAQTE